MDLSSWQKILQENKLITPAITQILNGVPSNSANIEDKITTFESTHDWLLEVHLAKQTVKCVTCSFSLQGKTHTKTIPKQTCSLSSEGNLECADLGLCNEQ